MVAQRKRSDVAFIRLGGRPRKKASEPSVRTKAGRRKKPRIGDIDSSTQVEAFQLLEERLWEIYRRADERAADVQQEVQDKLENLRGELENDIEKVTKTTCDEIKNLLGEIEDRNEELKDRDDQ